MALAEGLAKSLSSRGLPGFGPAPPGPGGPPVVSARAGLGPPRSAPAAYLVVPPARAGGRSAAARRCGHNVGAYQEARPTRTRTTRSRWTNDRRRLNRLKLFSRSATRRRRGARREEGVGDAIKQLSRRRRIRTPPAPPSRRPKRKKEDKKPLD